VTGCGAGKAEARDVVRLRAWTMWGGEEAEAFQRTLDAFNATHLGIRVENLPAVDDPKIIRSIVANDPPKLFTLREPSYLGSLASNGALEPLDDNFRDAGFREQDQAPGALSQCRFKGRLYGLLFLEDCLGLIYSRDAFREAGLVPDRPPRTFEELLDAAKRLTKRDASGRNQRLGWMPLKDIHMLLAAYGGRFVDPETGGITADDAQNVAALEWYAKVIEAQGGPEAVMAFAAGFGDEQGINNPFLRGKVAMMFNGQWNPFWFERYGGKVDYGVAPLPHPKNSPNLVGPNWLGGNLFCIPANCRHPREAWEFLKWTQSIEAQVLFAEHMHGIPNLLAARRTPSLRTGADWKPKYALFMDLATSPNARHFPTTPVSGLYQYELTNAADFVRFGARTPSDALADVQRRVSREAFSWER
jgi:multiple sugar transport system substrate-binding protein